MRYLAMLALLFAFPAMAADVTIPVPDGYYVDSYTVRAGDGPATGGTDTGGTNTGGTDTANTTPPVDTAAWCPPDQYDYCVGADQQLQEVMRANPIAKDTINVRFQPNVSHRARVQVPFGNLVVIDLTDVLIDCNGVGSKNGIQDRGCVSNNIYKGDPATGAKTIKFIKGEIDASTIPGGDQRGVAAYANITMVGTKFRGCLHVCYQGSSDYFHNLRNVVMENCDLSNTKTRHCIYTAPGAGDRANPPKFTIIASQIGRGMKGGDAVKVCQDLEMKDSEVWSGTGDAGSVIHAKCNFNVTISDSVLHKLASAGNTRIFGTDASTAACIHQKPIWTLTNVRIDSEIPNGSVKMYCEINYGADYAPTYVDGGGNTYTYTDASGVLHENVSITEIVNFTDQFLTQ